MKSIRCFSQLKASTMFKMSMICTRNLSSMTHSRNITTSKDENQEMMDIWPNVIKDLIDTEQLKCIPYAAEWMTKSLTYNATHGKKIRTHAIISAYKKLAPSNQLTEENLRLLRILCWIVEMIHAHVLVLDDVADNSKMRRGQPCWYLQKNVGLAAINDGVLLEQGAYRLLQKHLSDKPYYLDLLHTLQELSYKTTIGQLLDVVITNKDNKVKFKLFSTDIHKSIAYYKTSFFTTILPIKLAMYFAGMKDPEVHMRAEKLLLEMGVYYQIQNDYLDCFTDLVNYNKDGNDIKEGKCTWFAIKALELGTAEQKKMLEECYGKNDAENVARVKQLYVDLGLQKKYLIYEKEYYKLLRDEIEKISPYLPQDIFIELLHTIYNTDYIKSVRKF